MSNGSTPAGREPNCWPEIRGWASASTRRLDPCHAAGCLDGLLEGVHPLARGRRLAVEFFSPTYSKYLLGVLYNLLDFSDDPVLQRLAENAVTLWWALGAQEQLGGVHGGSKARFYPDRMQAGAPADGLSWLYLGTGLQPASAAHPAHFPMLTSRYRLPNTVRRLRRTCLGAAPTRFGPGSSGSPQGLCPVGDTPSLTT